MDLCIFPSTFLRSCCYSDCLLLPQTPNLHRFLLVLDPPYGRLLLCVVGHVLSSGINHTHENFYPEQFNLSVSLHSTLEFLIPLLEERT